MSSVFQWLKKNKYISSRRFDRLSFWIAGLYKDLSEVSELRFVILQLQMYSWMDVSPTHARIAPPSIKEEEPAVIRQMIPANTQTHTFTFLTCLYCSHIREKTHRLSDSSQTISEGEALNTNSRNVKEPMLLKLHWIKRSAERENCSRWKRPWNPRPAISVWLLQHH